MMNEPVQPVNHNKNERNAHDEGSRGEAAGIVAQRPAPPDRKVIGPAPPRRRLQPSEKQLKQQSSSQNHPQRQKSFNSGSHQTIMAGLYDLEETLGKGHFATVKAAKHVFTGERVAVKVIEKTKLDAVSQKALLKEVLCMKLVQHPNVVRLYEVIDTTTKMYLVLELGQGDLYDLILRQQGGLPEDSARVYFRQILTAVSYCHKLHVAHRDLKPENVVFFPPTCSKSASSSTSSTTSSSSSTTTPTSPPPCATKQSSSSKTHPHLGQVKLTDFGFSNKFCPGVNLDTSCGSLAYSAPEILLGDSYDAPAVDIWSLGVILYMLVCGRAPFQEANDSETLTMIMDVKYSIPDHLTGSLKDLIRKMLVRDPRRRARLEEIEVHSWVTKGGKGRRGSSTSSSVFEGAGGGADEAGDRPGALPLIASNTLTEHESDRIFNEMVKGGVVSSVEEVKTSLRTNAYNHVTSTYYLLAERFLREKARRSSRITPTDTPSSSSALSPTSSKTPTPTPSQHASSTSDDRDVDDSPPPSPPMIIRRKNSHQFEDVVLPSTMSAAAAAEGGHAGSGGPVSIIHHLHQQQQQIPKSTPSIASLDLETRTSSQRLLQNRGANKFVCLPVFEPEVDEEVASGTCGGTGSGSELNAYVVRSRNSSPHHPHYYHHLGKRLGGGGTPQQQGQQRVTTPPNEDSSGCPVADQQSAGGAHTPSSRGGSPPKYCSGNRPRMNKSHHSHSDSSDEGGGGGVAGGGASSAQLATTGSVNIVVNACGSTSNSTNEQFTNSSPVDEEEEETDQQQPQHYNRHFHHHHHHHHHAHHQNRGTNNNVFLKPSPSYEGIVDDETTLTSTSKSSKQQRGKKKRVLFLSWFFKRAGGGKISGSGGGGDRGSPGAGAGSSGGKRGNNGGATAGANGIYKTRSCGELKTRGCGLLGTGQGAGNESFVDLSTRECFGVCNGGPGGDRGGVGGSGATGGGGGAANNSSSVSNVIGFRKLY